MRELIYCVCVEGKPGGIKEKTLTAAREKQAELEARGFTTSIKTKVVDYDEPAIVNPKIKKAKVK